VEVTCKVTEESQSGILQENNFHKC